MSDTPTTSPAPMRSKRWPKVLLALSLTLNLAVIGMVAGAHYRDDRDVARFGRPERDTMRNMGVGPFFDALPRDVKFRMGQALRERAGALRPDRGALEADLAAISAALRAEPFDPAALNAVLEAQQARLAGRVAQGREVMVSEIAQMSPAERAAFADRLQQTFQRPPPPAPAPPPGRDDG